MSTIRKAMKQKEEEKEESFQRKAFVKERHKASEKRGCNGVGVDRPS